MIDLPFGVDIDKFNPVFEVGDAPTFYHIGSMNWMPNEEGIKWFLNNVWDKVLKRIPDAKLYLAGRNMPKWLKKTKKKNVIVVGEVPDAHQFVDEHNIAIVPLFSGSGMRIKIIESMALGKTVITTVVGAEGIQYSEFDDIIIADNEPKMVENICRLYKHPEEAEAKGIEGRVIVRFVVEKDGRLTNFEVMDSPDPLLSEEALRILKKMPAWIPAKNKGKDVRCRYSMPVMFRLK